ncbi:sex-determining protein fem-1-like [Haliotis rufescens]|uniref:sex-determining protein fem-1-like n=1 Tax=Haliotis rufescens TaxID=6454 RepID=UPI00201EA1C5|nr:sex-determining protein fem-1-like [Haliotis rufescens]
MHQGEDHAAPQGAARPVTIPDNFQSFVAACRWGHLAIIRSAVNASVVDVNRHGLNGTTPLIEAAGSGHLEVMKFLMDKGADPRQVEGTGRNILHVASMRGDVQMLTYILENATTIHIETTTDEGMTALDWAQYWEREEVKTLLLNRGALPSSVKSFSELL